MNKPRNRILIHTLVFSPDCVSTAYLYNDIAIGLKNNGYDVVVLTTTPHYNIIESEIQKQPMERKFFGLYFESRFHGIKIYHFPTKKFKNTYFRLFSFVYWHIFSFLFALTIKKLNVIISPSPPLSIGLVSLLIAKIKRAKSIYNVQELYPDLLISKTGLNSTFLVYLLSKIERIVYNFSDSITVISREFYEKVTQRIDNPNKVKIIPNFVDTDLYRPLQKGFQLSPVFNQNSEKFILMYAGNIGYYQDWSPILYAAQQLNNENLEFWIIGEGVQKEELQKDIIKNKLENLKIFPYQSREFMPQIINFADIHFISINSKMEEDGFPSKIYTLMACAKPVIVITGKKSPLYNFLSDKDCAVLITENRNQNFVNAIKKLKEDKSCRTRLGNNGLRFIKEEFSNQAVVAKYIDLIQSI